MPSIVLADMIRSGLRKRLMKAAASSDVTQSRIRSRNFLFNVFVMAYSFYGGYRCGVGAQNSAVLPQWSASSAWRKHPRLTRHNLLRVGRAGVRLWLATLSEGLATMRNREAGWAAYGADALGTSVNRVAPAATWSAMNNLKYFACTRVHAPGIGAATWLSRPSQEP
jgi:hypothetical protein